MLFENIIVMLILLTSIAVSLGKLRRAFAIKKQTGCNSGCTSCPLKQGCSGNS